MKCLTIFTSIILSNYYKIQTHTIRERRILEQADEQSKSDFLTRRTSKAEKAKKSDLFISNLGPKPAGGSRLCCENSCQCNTAGVA